MSAHDRNAQAAVSGRFEPADEPCGGAVPAAAAATRTSRQRDAADRRGARDRRLGLADRARPRSGSTNAWTTPIPRSRWPARSAARSRSASATAGCSPACATRSRTGATGGGILANIDFLGEGDEEKLTGRIHSFRRGVTRYPIPGALIYPATTADLRQIYACDGRTAIQIGTVYPTSDIRAGLYVDAMLGKHFALLGSTGTGKSTSAALILHRICEARPRATS